MYALDGLANRDFVFKYPAARVRTFKISYPNWCALRHDARDLIIRKMLADSGIEPMEPDTKAESSAE